MSRLGGLITSSDDPKRLADFYRSHFDIPYRVNQHGDLPAHYECDEDGVHFAIIPGRTNSPGNIAPSFFVEDLDAKLAEFEREGVKPLHAVMELGGGPRISTIRIPTAIPSGSGRRANDGSLSQRLDLMPSNARASRSRCTSVPATVTEKSGERVT